MLRWLILLVLTVAPATVAAQPGRPVPTTRAASAATARAQRTTTALERRFRGLEAKRRGLDAQLAQQTAEIDRLKKQRTSWRQQRELKDKMAAANDTATQLTAVTADRAKVITMLTAARRTLVQAIDAELAAGAVAARATELGRLRRGLVPQVSKARRVSRIKLPELEIDPLADPEELDEHAAALRESEAQLVRQIAGLEQQAAELDQVAMLRRQHDRAGELSRRDDDQPQRTAREGGNSRTFAAEDGASAPQSGGDGSPSPPSGGGGTGTGGGESGLDAVGTGFEADASIVLAEVVDPATLETLARASRSGDPATRARAAKTTRDVVKHRLEQLKKKRAQIEALARQRRK